MIHLRALLPLSITPFVAALGIVFGACSSEGNPHAAAPVTSKTDTTAKETRVIVPVDYSLGRAMNTRIGKGINLGNSWDSDGNRLDSSWGNPIRDYDFPFIKKAGFNSVRIPVRWQRNSDYGTHTVDPERLAGVKEDIQLAIDQGLVVIVNFHHYVQLNCAGGGGQGCTYDSTAYEAEKAHFLGMWAQVAQEMDAFPDSMIVLEILNEPTISDAERVDKLMNEAYQVIRSVTKTKTIMFESYHSAKFEDLNILHLPADGNIIYSGHYYEPYGFSHQGHSYPCKGDATYNNDAFTDLSKYVKQAKALYPDVNGVDQIPMNMGEFGISGGTDYANKNTCKEGESLPSAKMKAQWAQLSIRAAETYGISWNYWGFTSVGGFEAAHHNAMDENIEWYEGFPAAFGL